MQKRAVVRPRQRRAAPLAAILLAALWLAGCAHPADDGVRPRVVVSAAPESLAELRRLLAPQGRLRVAVYAGSPTSLVSVAGESRGVSVEVGRELARVLGLPVELVQRERVAQVIEALQQDEADMTVTNATAARAALVDFTEPLLHLELGILVPAGARLTDIDALDQAGLRIGVSQGSSSQAALGRRLKQAELVPAASLKDAAAMLKDGRIDAFATNKGILNELADGLPGARILDGRWGLESLALAVPKGRGRAHPFLQRFVVALREQGVLEQAAARAGLRGLAPAQAR